MKRLVIAFDAQARLNASAEFLKGCTNPEILIVATTRAAADELVRAVCLETGSVSGVHRFTLLQLAMEAASKRLVEAGKTILAGVAVDALAARAVYECRSRGELQWFESVARTSGFFRALASTISDLRLNGITPGQLEHSPPSGEDLSHLLAQYGKTLDDSGLADAASIYSTAAASVRNGEFSPAKLPIVFLDVAPASQFEREFIRALASQSDEVLATAQARDEEAVGVFKEALGAAPTQIDTREAATALDRLRRHVFEIATPPAATLDDTIHFISATDENRECVEIARSILAAAQTGAPFDRMAIALRNPDLYQPLLEDAFRRAAVPAFFTRGTRRPNPGGRAFLTLLACASEKLSASRFSEYLSLAQVPDLHEVPAVQERKPVWVAPQGELFPDLRAPEPEAAEETPKGDSDSPVIAGTLRSPRHWERLLVDAAVIGGYDRWVRRLKGLEQELQARIEELGAEEEPIRARLEQDLARLKNLERFALPIVKFLHELPDGAMWNEWLNHLEQLASIAIRQPESVLSVLAELRPMSGIGPVTLDEVREALSERLRFLRTEPTERRYGKVFVASIPELSGLSFDVIFLPGLGEDIFPRKAFEDPLLLDAQRVVISPHLDTQDARVRRERMLLHMAGSAANRRLWISYPRMDLGQGRARGPSFYALDVLRAVTGQIPELRTLAQRAAEGSQSQLGWPAPRDPSVAIDDSEYDLAVISAALRKPAAEVRGVGRYLVENATLARSVRARWARWDRSWSPHDGTYFQPTDKAFPVLQQHRLTSRPYSATALQQFAMCPYRFVLYSLYKLQPREEIAALERMDPLTRGRLFHAVQFRLLSRLKSFDLLPITADNQARVVRIADEVLDEVAAIYSEELNPAIPRVWDSEIEEVRWDLRGWIRQIVRAPDNGQWKPAWFELAFGLGETAEHDAMSSPDPITLWNGVRLRGAIDMIEESGDGIRITDHKTGKAPLQPVQFVGKGEVLQPLLYAEAAASLLGKRAADSRLSYCTEVGGYRVMTVVVDDAAREAIDRALQLIDQSIASGFLPAAPRKDACAYCDYHIVCGPYEELRVRRKSRTQLASINELREMP